jgi:hypothetical protein
MNKRVSAGLTILTVLVLALASVAVGAALRSSSQSSYDATARPANSKLQVYPGRYIVRLSDAPLATYRGGVPGLAATTPAATGARKLDVNSAPAVAYRNYLASKQADVVTAMRAATGRKITPLRTLDTAFNGLIVDLQASEVAKIAALPGVVAVEPDLLFEPDTDRGPDIVGAVQADQKPAIFKATLSGAQEVPANASTATGEAIAVYDAIDKTLSYRVEVTGLSGVPGGPGAHIHLAPAGANGPVVVNIFDTMVLTGTSAVFIGTKTITDAAGFTVAQIEEALYEGNLYFNVHVPPTFNGGEVRGQIQSNLGEGMIVGIIDSGINATNKAFADVGGDGYDHTNPLGAGNYLGVCKPGNQYARTAAEFPCNDKLIGAYTWEATNSSPNTGVTPALPSPNDEDSHGSHTASTAAGNVVSDISISGLPVGQVSGVAPHANVVAFDVCGFIQPNGTYSPACPTSASLSSINQAVIDGIDVLNFSISGATNPWASSVDLAFLAALEGGVLGSTSAGNNGPNAATVAHNGPWQMNVAATTVDRTYTNGLDAITKTATDTTVPSDTLTLPNMNGFGGSGSSGPLQIVYAKNYTDTTGAPNELCRPFSAASAAAIAGKMVICDRGVIGRVEKGDNVKAAGGAAFILANTSAAQSLNGDIYSLPGVHISSANGTALKTWLSRGSGHTAQIRGGTKVIDPNLADAVAAFSSRGPSAVGDLLAPDVAAPGQDIIAVYRDIGPGDEYGILSGTSMASPHNAGALALVRQAHPDWSLMEIVSALMTTADDILADPFSMGSGRINVSNAVQAGLVLNETVARMESANPGEGGDPRILNVPTFADDACIVSCSWTRTVRSTLDVTTTWTADTYTDTVGLSLAVTPSTITLGPGATASFTVTATVNGAEFGEYGYGFVYLEESKDLAPVASFPLVVQPVPADLPDEIDLAGGQAGSGSSEPIVAIPISDLTVEIAGLARASVDEVYIEQDSDNSDIYDDLTDGLFIKSIAVTSDTVRFVTKVISTTSSDIDMFVHLDKNKDGKPSEDEQVCVSATGAALEVCDFEPELTADGTMIVVVENWEASSPVTGTLDFVELETAAVRPTNEGNLSVTGPDSVAGKVPFTITLSWDLSGDIGDVFYGLVSLGTSPGLAAAGDLGVIPVRVELNRAEVALPMIRK